MFNALAVTAKAKLIKNKKLDTLRLIVAFNVYEKNDKGTYKFPTQSKCAYVSGDLDAADVFNALASAKRAICADIVVVD
jgi:hypothetical protein